MRGKRVKLFGVIGIFLILVSVMVALALNKNTIYQNNKIEANKDEVKAYIKAEDIALPQCPYYKDRHEIMKYVPAETKEKCICPDCGYTEAAIGEDKFYMYCSGKPWADDSKSGICIVTHIYCYNCYINRTPVQQGGKIYYEDKYIYKGVRFYDSPSGTDTPKWYWYFHEDEIIVNKYTVAYNGNKIYSAL